MNSRTDAPGWWNEELHRQALRAATNALPNEACGLFFRPVDEADVRLRTFTGPASPTSCVADADQLIAFAYDLQFAAGHVVATFHSHPQGEANFSSRDAQLALWSPLHVLFILSGTGDWQATWGKRVSV